MGDRVYHYMISQLLINDRSLDICIQACQLYKFNSPKFDSCSIYLQCKFQFISHVDISEEEGTSDESFLLPDQKLENNEKLCKPYYELLLK